MLLACVHYLTSESGYRLSAVLLTFHCFRNLLKLLCVLRGARRQTGTEAPAAPYKHAAGVASEEESFVLVDAPNSEVQPVSPEVVDGATACRS